MDATEEPHATDPHLRRPRSSGQVAYVNRVHAFEDCGDPHALNSSRDRNDANQQADISRSSLTSGQRLGTLVIMATVPDRVYEELVEEFGDDAPAVAERALRSEITRHRIATAITRGVDPAKAVADALARDPVFLADSDDVTVDRHPSSDLQERLRRWG